MMGDVGRSTASHIDRHEINYALGHEALDNYGAWYRGADDGTRRSIVQPMFKDIKRGYRDSSSLRTQYDEDYAILIDRLMAQLLTDAEIAVVFCRYVRAEGGRIAAQRLSSSGNRVSANEYAMRLEAVVARVDMAIYLINERDCKSAGRSV